VVSSVWSFWRKIPIALITESWNDRLIQNRKSGTKEKAKVVEPSHPTRICVFDWFIHFDLPQPGLCRSPHDDWANYSRGQPIWNESDSWYRLVWSWNMGHRAPERARNSVGCHICLVSIGRPSDAGESVRTLLRPFSLPNAGSHQR
jgi:hypothetical protein